MAKLINSPADLERLRAQYRSNLDLRNQGKDIRITVHMGTCGIAAGAREVLMTLADQLAKAGVEKVMLTQSGCVGMCEQEPMMTLREQSGREYIYGKLDARKVGEIVRQHILAGSPVLDCIVNPPKGTLVKGTEE